MVVLLWNLRGESADIVVGVVIGTEGIAAIKAAKVVQHAVIQDIAENHASGSPSGTTQQRPNDGTADAAHGRTDWSGNDSQGCARLGTERGSRIATVGTGRRTDHTSGFLAVVVLADPDGQAVGALFRHWKLPL